MIVSHKYRFIYFKTIKTASTSIENTLSAICGPDDIITPTAPRFMKHRKDQRAQHYRSDHPSVPAIPLHRRLLGREEKYHHPSVGFYEHMPAWRVKAYLDEETWSSYYKFSFERNPWDRQVSFYQFRIVDKHKKLTFEQFLKKKRKAYVDNWGIYAIGEEVCTDFLGRYERLADDFQHVIDHLGLPDSLALPNLNAGSAREDYRTYYDDGSRQRVADWYQKEIELLDYAF